MPAAPHATLFASGAYRCVELRSDDVGALQRFLEANPEYYRSVNGHAPTPDQARDELHFELPAQWTYGRKWVVAFERSDDAMIGVAGLVSDLFVPGVWHVGLFLVATSLHGTGVARHLYGDLEAWMVRGGARWLRLGVVEGNTRAERFWERLGYVEVRKRRGIDMGERTNTVRVMVKPLGAGRMEEYLEQVARDRPD